MSTFQDLRGLWLLFYYLGKRENDSTILAGRENDSTMRIKKDGHIRFYTKDEWNDICSRQGLITVDSFDSSIRFPRKKDTAYGYEEVLKKHDKAVIDSYNLVETTTELFLTEHVNNILFRKSCEWR